jgi:hypothetical protein
MVRSGNRPDAINRMGYRYNEISPAPRLSAARRKNVTIDERLDRLTERHEALTQSVELLLIAQRHTDEAQARNEDAHAKTQILLANVVESIGRLERIAFAHEDRISKLEGGRA